MNEMSVQTRIKGVEHKILVRPEKYDVDPFEDKSSEDKGRLNEYESISIG